MTRTRTTRALAAVLAFLLFATLLFAGMPVRAAGELVLKEGAAITYNKDASVMKADAVKALVDLDASGIPADYDLADFDVEYAFLGANAVADVLGVDTSALGSFGEDLVEKWANLWVNAETGYWDAPTISVPIGQSIVDGIVSRITTGIQDALENTLGVGFNHIQAGSDQIVRVRYQGGDWVTGTLTVNKANVKVNVKSASLYFDQVVGENFVTTDPEDDFMIFTFYSGVTTDLAPTIYFQPPENELLSKAMEIVIDPLYICGITGGIVGWLLGRSRRGAFICGVLGVLLADIISAVTVWAGGVSQKLVLGGAGLFDSVVISGFLAVLLCELVGETLERFARARGVSPDPQRVRMPERKKRK